MKTQIYSGQFNVDMKLLISCCLSRNYTNKSKGNVRWNVRPGLYGEMLNMMVEIKNDSNF